MPTLLIAPDIAEIYGGTRSTVEKWRANGYLGEPETIVSGHAVWTLERLSVRLAAALNPPRDSLRGRPPVIRAPDLKAIGRVRARSQVESGAVPVGFAEIAYCMWKAPAWMAGPGRLALLPDPIALLGPPAKPDGRPARQERAFDLHDFTHWPEFDRHGRGAAVLATRQVA